MAKWKALNLQDAASPLMKQLIFFHDHAMLILVLMTTLVGFMLSSPFFSSLTNRILLEHQTIETIWTILPAIILIFIALPSRSCQEILNKIDKNHSWISHMSHINNSLPTLPCKHFYDMFEPPSLLTDLMSETIYLITVYM